MKKLNINPETIQSCYDKSFSAGDDELDDNTLLSE